MNSPEQSDERRELLALCGQIRELVQRRDFVSAKRLVSVAMGDHPHAPEPHNLLGVLLEMRGDHAAAMKHFRAAWALDPTYVPARQNLDTFGTFLSRGRCAYDESDCPKDAGRSDRRK